MTLGKRGVIVSVTHETRARMRARSAQTGVTFPDLALDAVEAQAAHLPKHYADKSPAPAPAPAQGKIFARKAQGGQRGPSRAGEVTVNLQLLDEDIRILDRMWREAGAPSRSHYLATALRLYLESARVDDAT